MASPDTQTDELTCDVVLRRLSQLRETLHGLGVRRLGLFGSASRTDEPAPHDLDFVVEFDRKSFDAYMDLKHLLEDLFACPIDLVLADAIKPRLRETILAEAVNVPEL